jgi:methionyl-tRNA formyltransferase
VRIVFFGTPEFAVPSLEAVAREHEVVLVVAQPDKPSGRGMKLQSPAVVLRARALGLPVAQPPKVREVIEQVAALQPDAGVVVAYGKILPPALLTVPFYNVHGSILPKYRGAAPIQRAIEAGETETGVTIMRVDEELDHGPMLLIEKTPIGPDERTPQLAQRLSRIGAEALAGVLREMPPETPQDHAQATLAPKIEKAEGEITFREAAHAIYNRFRAFEPWPGIFYKDLKLTNCHPERSEGPGRVGHDARASQPHPPRSLADARDDTGPGTILSLDEHVLVACAEGAIRILEMQRPGKPRTPAGAVARGLGWRVGDVL